MGVTYENDCQERGAASAIRSPCSVSVDDESVTYAGSRPRMKWDTGRAIRHFGSGSPRAVSRP
jgi:hypothetical protein